MATARLLDPMEAPPVPAWTRSVEHANTPEERTVDLEPSEAAPAPRGKVVWLERHLAPEDAPTLLPSSLPTPMPRVLAPVSVAEAVEAPAITRSTHPSAEVPTRDWMLVGMGIASVCVVVGFGMLVAAAVA